MKKVDLTIIGGGAGALAAATTNAGLPVCACRTVSFEDVPKAVIVRRTGGLIKMGVDPKTQQIVGVHIPALSSTKDISKLSCCI